MNINVLGQGFEEKSTNSVGHILIKSFSNKDFHTFTGISAFASQAGIKGLSKHINAAKKHLKIITIVTGVDQKGKSKEALDELLALKINSFVFYQPAITIFHPKIYLFEGALQTKLIVGSSNLTGTGLFVNVQGSLLVEFDNNDPEGIILLNELKTYYQTLFDLSDPNLFSISDSVIADFVGKRANLEKCFYTGKIKSAA